MVASEVSTVLDPGNAANHENDVQTFQHTVQSLSAYATTPAAKSAIGAVNAAFDKWHGIDDQVLALVKAHKTAAAAKIANSEANGAADALTTAVENASKAISSANTNAANSTASSSKTLMLVIALVALLIAGGISFALARDLSRRIKVLLDGIHSLESNCVTDLGKGLEAIAGGDLTVVVTPQTHPIPTTRADEIGELTRSFNGMVDKTQTSVEAYNTLKGGRNAARDRQHLRAAVAGLPADGQRLRGGRPRGGRDRPGRELSGRRRRGSGPLDRRGQDPYRRGRRGLAVLG
jgi:HAMP domain-containing protein